MMLRRLCTISTVLTATLLAGCSTGHHDVTPGASIQGSSKLQVKTKADAERMVQGLADSVATAVGNPLEDFHTTAAPCDDAVGADPPWSLSGVANVAVKPADQVPTLTRLRDQWKQQGYEVTEFLLTPPDAAKEGRVSVRVPADDLTVTVLSTAPRTGFAIIVATPCYKPAPGENPGNE